ncbi:hypothetical protein GIB67_001032 [Kingdonia uniflora]|uniref:Uncharacterized protein n=1 Tax=Kingdonia uniflora TaxID=39325 RepID=A0A7J7MFV4_9MAGN|nr:hypothetical protein GIB67_001032 [Kingdonia uniflora]
MSGGDRLMEASKREYCSISHRKIELEAVFGETCEAAIKLFPERASPLRGDRLQVKWAMITPDEALYAVIRPLGELTRRISREDDVIFRCKLWNLAYGTHVRTILFSCMIWGFVMDSTETNFYAGGSDENDEAITAVAIAYGGVNLVSASEDGDVRIWDTESGQDRRRAIDRLEAAIGTYQRLLGLILNEAKGGGTVTESNNSSKDKAAKM